MGLDERVRRCSEGVATHSTLWEARIRVVGLLSRKFENRCVIRHGAREKALPRVVTGLAAGGALAAPSGAPTPSRPGRQVFHRGLERSLGGRPLHAERKNASNPRWCSRRSRAKKDQSCSLIREISRSTGKGSCSNPPYPCVTARAQRFAKPSILSLTPQSLSLTPKSRTVLLGHWRVPRRETATNLSGRALTTCTSSQ